MAFAKNPLLKNVLRCAEFVLLGVVRVFGDSLPRPSEKLEGWGDRSALGPMNMLCLGLCGWYCRTVLTGDGHPKRGLVPARKALLEWFRGQLIWGHCARKGGAEALIGDNHAGFYLSSILLAWLVALKNNDVEVAATCERWVGHEIALSLKFRCGQVVAAPNSRAKEADDDAPGGAQVGTSRARDVVVARVLEEEPPVPSKTKSGTSWWDWATEKSQGYSLGPVLMHEILKRDMDDSIRRRLLNSPLPKLWSPINRIELPGGGYAAWLDDTPENHKSMPDDALSCVIHRRPGKVEAVYDFDPLPVEIQQLLDRGENVQRFGEKRKEPR